MTGATKEVLIAGPGSGKTTYLAGRALEPSALSLDPVGQLRKLVIGTVDVVTYDQHGKAAFEILQKELKGHFNRRRPILIDTSELSGNQMAAFASDLGTWLRSNMRGGVLIVDELRWYIPPSPGSEHGLLEFIAKCRNYDVAVVVAGHRPATLHKDVVGLCDTFRVGRLVHPLDLEAATKLLKSQVSGRQIDGLAAKLPHLEPGYWYVMKGAAPG